MEQKGRRCLRLDKPEDKKHRITVKINGKERHFQEGVIVHRWDEGMEEQASTDEAVLVDENEEKPVVSSSYKSLWNRKKGFGPFRGRDILKWWTTIVSALVTGGVFGLIMLNFFSSDEPVSQKVTKTTPTVNKENQTYQLPTVSVSVIQLGAFQQEEAALQFEQSLKQNGLPTKIVHDGNQYFIFAGMTKELTTAKQLAATLKEKGIDAYAKKWTLTGKTIELTPSEENALLMLNESFQVLLQQMDQYVSSSSLDHTALEKEYINIQSLKEKEFSPQLKEYVRIIDQTFQQLLSLGEGKNDIQWWKTQATLLSMFSIY